MQKCARFTRHVESSRIRLAGTRPRGLRTATPSAHCFGRSPGGGPAGAISFFSDASIDVPREETVSVSLGLGTGKEAVGCGKGAETMTLLGFLILLIVAAIT